MFGNLFELRGGAFADYVAVPERLLVQKPAQGDDADCGNTLPIREIRAIRGKEYVEGYFRAIALRGKGVITVAE